MDPDAIPGLSEKKGPSLKEWALEIPAGKTGKFKMCL
jgi:hypothetical protein